MKAYVVKKPGQIARAFLVEDYIGLVPDPEEHARAEALEYMYEGVSRDNLKKNVIEKKFDTTVLLEEV